MAGSDMLKGVKISTRVVLAGLFITALFVAVTFAWILPRTEDALMAKKREKIREATEAAWSVLAHYEALARKGEMTAQASQATAADIIRSMRYGPEMKDYFWVNDMRPFMLVHPYRPDMEGADASNVRDQYGVRILVEAVRIARETGEGFLAYWWQWQDDQTKIVPKISYVRLFRPWGWVVGTGMYVEDIRQEIRAWKIQVGIVCLLLALVGAALSWFMGRQVARSLRELSGSHGEPDEEGLRRAGGLVCRLQTFILFVVVPALLVLTAVWCGVIYRDLHSIILSGFERKLVSVSSATGCFIKGEDHARIALETNEASELYQTYVRPMKKIARKVGLSYLYSQVLSEEKPFCNYILDATEGAGHSAVGSRDELPMADYRGAEKVVLYGITHVGEVQPTENWGLLKVSYAPIYNRDDTITAMAGADVNISIISDKMRTALFAVALMGVATLLLAGYVSVVFSRQLTRPVNTLKDGALIVAAGTYGHKIVVEDPVELKGLSESFSKIGATLEMTLKNTADADGEMEQRKRRRDLVVALDRMHVGMSRTGTDCRFAFLGNPDEMKSTSGWVALGSETLCWIGRPAKDPLDAVRLRNDVGLVCAGLLQRWAGKPQELLRELRRLFSDDVQGFLMFDPNSGTLQGVIREPIDGLLLKDGRVEQAITLSDSQTLVLKAGQLLVLCDDRDFLSCLMSGHTGLCGGERNPAPQQVLAYLEATVKERSGETQIMVGILSKGRST